MKPFLIFILTIFTLSNTVAQVKTIAPLSCFTWGPDQFLDLETVKRNALPDLLGPYNYRSTPSPERYNSFLNDRSVYSWLPDDQRFQYINNVQVIRWNIQDKKNTYTISVKNIFDEEFYSVSTENACGVIIFPDSIQTEGDRIFVAIRPSNLNSIGWLPVINFSDVELMPRNKTERLSVLKELQACTTLECKIEKLKAHHATIDMLSLLELEKMKDPSNKLVDKLYWEITSQILSEYCSRSWER